jgi:hypothetical protein
MVREFISVGNQRRTVLNILRRARCSPDSKESLWSRSSLSGAAADYKIDYILVRQHWTCSDITATGIPELKPYADDLGRL